MRRKWLPAVAVFAVAGGLIVWREWRRPGTAPASARVSQAAVQVVLFADLSEVDEVEGCGAIIRGVREAAGRGVVTQEVDSTAPSSLVARYRLVMAPTVLFVDGAGHELARHEGEGPDTVRSIQAGLASLAPAR